MRQLLALRSLLGVIIMTALVCVSCLERRETITVDETGKTTIRAEFDGTEESFATPIALPSEPEWTVISKEVNPGQGETRIKLTAEKVVAYGEPLPATFAARDSVPSVDLRFPTEVKLWSEGNRTFYEFKRTYLTLPFGGINMTEDALWDQDLEDRILDQGIFNVSEEDRSRYIDEYSSSFGHLQWRFAWSALGQMVRRGDISASVKSAVNKRTFEYTEGAVTPVRILGILGKEEDSIGLALENLKTELRGSYIRIFADAVGPGKENLPTTFSGSLDSVILDYDITKMLEAQQISVTVNLPGTVIECNGLVDPDEPGSVGWLFMGADMRRANIPLYALSVVEH
ncbi:MAG: hypothetical protein JSV52_03395 [Candidatus Zixiibacteriota bacterium]|nr:MAG: hypothetical protein JSV52_03395 [candidate division Zixibacteria bacterium]